MRLIDRALKIVTMREGLVKVVDVLMALFYFCNFTVNNREFVHQPFALHHIKVFQLIMQRANKDYGLPGMSLDQLIHEIVDSLLNLLC